MQIIVSIPAYNEEQTIVKVIEDIKKHMRGYSYKILVIDDGSTDKTAKLAKKAGAIVYSNSRNLGLAETFQIELKKCLELKADIIIHTDADGQYPAIYIPELIKKIKEGYDLVLGARFSGRLRHMPFMKLLGNRAFAKALSNMLKIKITDSTTGFRAFTSRVAKEIQFINTFTYTQEQLIKAANQGFKIAEIPIKTRRTRKSKLFRSSSQYALKAWTNILRIYRDYEPLKFFVSIGLGFISIGVLIGLYILYNMLIYGGVGGIPRVILSALFIITGVQIVIFGFLADMLKK
jgi:glycosyltransferase involved in cell wall biosynthesis